VRVTPRSSRNRVEVVDGQVRIWVTASPTDGQANEAVCGIVAKTLGVAPSRVRVHRGHTARDKTLAVEGLAAEEIRQRIGS
jgi:uncharacterized protein YggU (UPF0235/DUF167 family)